MEEFLKADKEVGAQIDAQAMKRTREKRTAEKEGDSQRASEGTTSANNSAQKPKRQATDQQSFATMSQPARISLESSSLCQM